MNFNKKFLASQTQRIDHETLKVGFCIEFLLMNVSEWIFIKKLGADFFCFAVIVDFR